jgi:hypothetical protein
MAADAQQCRLGIAILDTPKLAIAAVRDLLAAGLAMEALCIIAVGPIMTACASEARRVAPVMKRLADIMRTSAAGNTEVEEEIVATSQDLFGAFLRTQLTPAGSIVRSQASRQKWDIENAIRDGAVALVAWASDTHQQQVVTRILLAYSSHNVTTYHLPGLEMRSGAAVL